MTNFLYTVYLQKALIVNRNKTKKQKTKQAKSCMELKSELLLAIPYRFRK